MKKRVLLDTGPIVALLDRRETHHAWALTKMADFDAPFLTCEAVVSEACFLLKALPRGSESVLELLVRGKVVVAFHLQEEHTAVSSLMARYANLPMSLADACLVRMSEQYAGSCVLTLDSDFRIYRRHGRQVIPTLMPPD